MARWGGRSLLLWAEAAAILGACDPLRRVTVAHALLLVGESNRAVETLTDALHRFSQHPARFVLWQNLGLAFSIAGDAGAALGAYRAAARSPGRVDREVAAVSMCIVGAKLKSVEDMRVGASILCERDGELGVRALRAAIQARRGRGDEPFWAFDDGDVGALAAAAPDLGVTEAWRVAQ
ncbi:MAG: hypothetical protein R3F49_08660 [Planctomycetota bacterium]